MLPWWWYLPYSNRILIQVRGVAKFITLKFKIALKTRPSLERVHAPIQKKSRKFWKFENLIRQILFIFFRDPVKKISASWDQFEKSQFTALFLDVTRKLTIFLGSKNFYHGGYQPRFLNFDITYFSNIFLKSLFLNFLGQKYFFWGPSDPRSNLG